MGVSTLARDAAGPHAGRAPEIRRWSREEFERAGEVGLFGPTERLELIDGEVVRKMSPQGSAHANSIARLEAGLRPRVGPGRLIRIQLPLALGDDSEPEPDIAIVDGTLDDYDRAHPVSARLVVEAADTSLQFDRTVKASLYARAEIPEYWIVNLFDRVLERFREPAAMAEQPFGHHYRSITRHTEDDAVAPLLGCEALVVRDFLPRP